MGIDALPPSLDHSANTLLELAGLFQAGRPELALTGRASAPGAHQEIADAVRDFAPFAHDQYQDAVSLLAALSTKLTAASAGYRQADADTARKMDEFLTGSTYRPAGR